MTRRTLQVTLDVSRPSVVELTVGDRVQLDRLVPSQGRHVAERHGALLAPGAVALELARGAYSFRTLSDASLRVVSGGVTTSAVVPDKDPWPDPPPRVSAPSSLGDELTGELPSFTVDSTPASQGRRP